MLKTTQNAHKQQNGQCIMLVSEPNTTLYYIFSHVRQFIFMILHV